MSAASLFERLKHSFAASAGDVVFGMEDGTVSIFGLVFGVAATTSDRSTVLIAGVSGAAAAAVSMMAGTYLDVETARDEARAAALSLQSEIDSDPNAILDVWPAGSAQPISRRTRSGGRPASSFRQGHPERSGKRDGNAH